MSTMNEIVDEIIQQQLTPTLWSSIHEAEIKSGSGTSVVIKPVDSTYPELTAKVVCNVRDSYRSGQKCLFTFADQDLTNPIIVAIDYGQSECVINSDSIKLGSQAAINRVVLWEPLKVVLQAMATKIDILFNSHTHLIIKPVPSEPTAPPLPLMEVSSTLLTDTPASTKVRSL